MQGLLIRNRKRPDAQVEAEVENQSIIGKVVVASVAAVLFGSIFLFFELYGKCGCSADVIGGFLLITGSLVLMLLCIKDLIDTVREEDDGVEKRTADDASKSANNNNNELPFVVVYKR